MQGIAAHVRRPQFVRPANDNIGPGHRPLLRICFWGLAIAAIAAAIMALRQ